MRSGDVTHLPIICGNSTDCEISLVPLYLSKNSCCWCPLSSIVNLPFSGNFGRLCCVGGGVGCCSVVVVSALASVVVIVIVIVVISSYCVVVCYSVVTASADHNPV